MKIISVVGARPNFMKVAPILRAIHAHNQSVEQAIEPVLIHTGQHYDDEMSAAFFADLDLPRPHRFLGVGSASHAAQTAEIMRRFETVVVEERPDAVLVVGDVNSTLACALVAAKLGVRVAHVEAGLRSFDRTMPEEINRVVTDTLSDFLFTTEESANDNLRREGHTEEEVFFVGNVMVDALRSGRALAERSDILDRLGLKRRPGGSDFAVATVHRPSNVDTKEKLAAILSALAKLAGDVPVIFPAHPRTRARITEFGLTAHVQAPGNTADVAAVTGGRVQLLNPVGYIDFLCLMLNARLVLTDSGGIQEETTCLGVPCLTLRDNTERPITVTTGTNTLVGTDPERIIAGARAALRNGRCEATSPPLWDGHAAERIVRILADRL